MSAETNSGLPVATLSNADLLREAIRFLRALQYRLSYLVTCLIAVALIGAFYYYTATRVYQATASLMVMESGADDWDPSVARNTARNDLIPTFEKLFFKSVILENAVLELQSLQHQRPELFIDFELIPVEGWAGVLRSNLTATSVRRTNIIELAYKSKNPKAAEEILNAILNSYMDFMERTHRDVSSEIVTILDAKLKQVEEELAPKQDELQLHSHNVHSLGLQENTRVVHPDVQRVLDLSTELDLVERQRLQLEQAVGSVRSAIDEGRDLRQHMVILESIVGKEVVLNALGIDPGSLATQREVERSLGQHLAELQSIQSHLGNNHPRVIKLVSDIQNEQRTLELLANSGQNDPNRLTPVMLLEMANTKYLDTLAYENHLRELKTQALNRAQSLQDEMVKLSILQHDVELKRKFQHTLINRIAELDLKQNRADIRPTVVDNPVASPSPVSPRLSYVVAICVMCGLGVGATMVYVLDVLDDRFRSPEEIKEQIGINVLGMVRELPRTDSTNSHGLHVCLSPTSVETESFRTLRTGLSLLAGDTQRVSITSSEPGDGKTTVLANLAASIAQAGKRVLLIDGDLRRPGLTKLFDYRHVGGLSNVLRYDGAPSSIAQDLIQATEVKGLDILPSGPKPADPSELLSREQFADLIGWAETVYDRVLIDSPPVFAASDAAIIGRTADNVLLVVQPHKNHRRMVIRAAESLLSVAVNLSGIVINQAGSRTDKGYYEYGYNYGYGYGYGYSYDSPDGPSSSGEGEEDRDYQQAA